MSKIIGAVLLLIGLMYVIGVIFWRIFWIWAHALANGIMIFAILVGVLLVCGVFSKVKN